MNYIKLITNDDNNESINYIVSDKVLDRLNELQTIGGFKHFEIDHIDDDQPKSKPDYHELKTWLSLYVFTSITYDLMFF